MTTRRRLPGQQVTALCFIALIFLQPFTVLALSQARDYRASSAGDKDANVGPDGQDVDDEAMAFGPFRHLRQQLEKVGTIPETELLEIVSTTLLKTANRRHIGFQDLRWPAHLKGSEKDLKVALVASAKARNSLGELDDYLPQAQQRDPKTGELTYARLKHAFVTAWYESVSEYERQAAALMVEQRSVEKNMQDRISRLEEELRLVYKDAASKAAQADAVARDALNSDFRPRAAAIADQIAALQADLRLLRAKLKKLATLQDALKAEWSLWGRMVEVMATEQADGSGSAAGASAAGTSTAKDPKTDAAHATRVDIERIISIGQNLETAVRKIADKGVEKALKAALSGMKKKGAAAGPTIPMPSLAAHLGPPHMGNGTLHPLHLSDDAIAGLFGHKPLKIPGPVEGMKMPQILALAGTIDPSMPCPTEMTCEIQGKVFIANAAVHANRAVAAWGALTSFHKVAVILAKFMKIPQLINVFVQAIIQKVFVSMYAAYKGEKVGRPSGMYPYLCFHTNLKLKQPCAADHVKSVQAGFIFNFGLLLLCMFKAFWTNGDSASSLGAVAPICKLYVDDANKKATDLAEGMDKAPKNAMRDLTEFIKDLTAAMQDTINTIRATTMLMTATTAPIVPAGPDVIMRQALMFEHLAGQAELAGTKFFLQARQYRLKALANLAHLPPEEVLDGKIDLDSSNPLKESLLKALNAMDEAKTRNDKAQMFADKAMLAFLGVSGAAPNAVKPMSSALGKAAALKAQAEGKEAPPKPQDIPEASKGPSNCEYGSPFCPAFPVFHLDFWARFNMLKGLWKPEGFKGPVYIGSDFSFLELDGRVNTTSSSEASEVSMSDEEIAASYSAGAAQDESANYFDRTLLLGGYHGAEQHYSPEELEAARAELKGGLHPHSNFLWSGWDHVPHPEGWRDELAEDGDAADPDADADDDGDGDEDVPVALLEMDALHKELGGEGVMHLHRGRRDAQHPVWEDLVHTIHPNGDRFPRALKGHCWDGHDGGHGLDGPDDPWYKICSLTEKLAVSTAEAFDDNKAASPAARDRQAGAEDDPTAPFQSLLEVVSTVVAPGMEAVAREHVPPSHVRELFEHVDEQAHAAHGPQTAHPGNGYEFHWRRHSTPTPEPKEAGALPEGHTRESIQKLHEDAKPVLLELQSLMQAQLQHSRRILAGTHHTDGSALLRDQSAGSRGGSRPSVVYQPHADASVYPNLFYPRTATANPASVYPPQGPNEPRIVGDGSVKGDTVVNHINAIADALDKELVPSDQADEEIGAPPVPTGFDASPPVANVTNMGPSDPASGNEVEFDLPPMPGGGLNAPMPAPRLPIGPLHVGSRVVIGPLPQYISLLVSLIMGKKPKKYMPEGTIVKVHEVPAGLEEDAEKIPIGYKIALITGKFMEFAPLFMVFPAPWPMKFPPNPVSQIAAAINYATQFAAGQLDGIPGLSEALRLAKQAAGKVAVASDHNVWIPQAGIINPLFAIPVMGMWIPNPAMMMTLAMPIPLPAPPFLQDPVLAIFLGIKWFKLLVAMMITPGDLYAIAGGIPCDCPCPVPRNKALTSTDCGLLAALLAMEKLQEDAENHASGAMTDAKNRYNALGPAANALSEEAKLPPMPFPPLGAPIEMAKDE